ncbi:hypothetical protein F5148DRAFT_1288589 [Russula earlei]|uniref:Uncharacterized protein n=1 Tax=Russula earlei TaxID=71964 RepID=A0ACC0U0H1_9AGAM|nr:hypothetical protein F5148DRAFT_1288589 [Russula earlei]
MLLPRLSMLGDFTNLRFVHEANWGTQVFTEACRTHLTANGRPRNPSQIFNQSKRPPPPFTRSVLPALTRVVFKGVHEYLEDVLAQIDAPLLEYLVIVFFMDLDFVLPQLHRLISHAKSFQACNRAIVRTSDSAVKDLRLSDEVARHVFQALKELADESVTEVLPALRNIFLSDLQRLESIPKNVEGFVVARQHDVTVHRAIISMENAPFSAMALIVEWTDCNL